MVLHDGNLFAVLRTSITGTYVSDFIPFVGSLYNSRIHRTYKYIIENLYTYGICDKYHYVWRNAYAGQLATFS